ncbi:RbsK Sugar kinases, ribokinase family [Candidatus Nanopelagicaceae bacterium]
MSSFEVVCLGIITIDTISLVDKYPGEDERVLAKQIIRAGGGPAAVAAVTLSRLGVSTAIAGTIGDDQDGAEVLKIFASEGVDTSGVSIGSSATSGSVIVASLENNSRAISTRQPMQQVALNPAAKKLIGEAKWLHVDHVGITQLQSEKITRGSGPKISFDAGYNVAEFDSSQVDLFVPTDKQMELRFPGLELAAAAERDALNSKNVTVATQGSSGSTGYSKESGLVHADSFKVDVVSTLGAGDVFHGALLAQVIQGYNLADSLVRANAVAALSCRGLDGQSMIPNTSELNAFLKEKS